MLRKAVLILASLCWLPPALADGDGREANAAEQAFSLKLRQAAQQALRKLPEGDWQSGAPEDLQPDTWVDADVARRPYGLTHETTLMLRPDSARGKRLAQESEQLMNAPGGPAADFAQRYQKIQAQSGASVVIEFNPAQAGLTVFTDEGGSWRSIKVPGADQAIRASKVQMRSGGGPDSSVDATAVYLGKWSAPAPDDSGGIGARAQRRAGAPYLSVQHVFVRVEAPAEIADELIPRIDLAALRALIQ